MYWLCWGFRPSGISHCVLGWTVLGVSKVWDTFILKGWGVLDLIHLASYPRKLEPSKEGFCVGFYPCLQFTLRKRISLQCLRLVVLLDHTKYLNAQREILSFVKVISDNSLSNVYRLCEGGVVSVVTVPWHGSPGSFRITNFCLCNPVEPCPEGKGS
jgi:hypothetical protein